MNKNKKKKAKLSRRHKHAYECRKYRKYFLRRHGYYFCESCVVNNTLVWSTHHIMSAGRYPRHPELHNRKNLMLLCVECHHEFEAHLRKDEVEKIVADRGLNKLFGRK